MNDEISMAGIYSAMVGWIVLTATWLKKKVSKDDFQIFRTEMREDMKIIHEQLHTLIERRNEPRA